MSAPPAAGALAVAFDVTPLAGFRSGLGQSVAGMWAALGRVDDLRLAPYAIGVAAAGGGTGIPEGSRVVRVPTRALVRVWSRTDRVAMDRWLPAAEVVHATNFTIGPTHRPALITVHDLGFAVDPASTDAVTATFEGMLRRAVGRGAHLHVTTRHGAEQAEAVLGPGLIAAGRVTVVPFGVPDLPAPGPMPARVAGMLAGRPYVLSLGDQLPRKNLPLLVEAFGRAAPDLGDLCLVVAGRPGPGTPALDAAIATLAPGPASRVLVTGPVDDATRSALLAGARVLAYPSRYEGFGLPPLEAMTLGVPALVSSAGALAEVAGPGAQLADPDDVEAWAVGLRRLVTDEARRAELVAAGRRHAAGFTWEATGAGLAVAYRRLASSS